ncbi:COX15/CtaA family protein [Hyphomicrobium sp. CS1BSMeth3]|uniref:COX15/CtaA family protein n=1 Tax=Hyphomicrobium sp. CS1BSMeth3 TaxID=1892844 RepID=UPI000B0A7EEC|nr:COX15/CtaA family protein [Hyphomicrobium sp. CS1BSMeth3]
MPDGSGRTLADPMQGVRWWLYGVAALVFALIVVGGATRLTDSGLSITEWRPIMGILPPLNEAEWQEALAKYRLIPEYKLVNKGMSLEAFKFIFWWEWGHRFLARMVGFAFAIPFVYFLVRGRLNAPLAWKLAGILALGGLQGAIGWFMVSSGLVDRIDVSHYRLALHLTVAFVIFALLLWTAWSLLPRAEQHVARPAAPRYRRMAGFIVALIFLQLVLGALVAGFKAGLTHNTWPLMDGQLIPDGLWLMSPWFLNVFENATTIQFNHRMIAYVIVALVLWHAASMARADDGRLAPSAFALAIAVLGQAALGIWTLLAQVPLSLGLAHQGLAAIVTAVALWHLFLVTRRGTVA